MGEPLAASTSLIQVKLHLRGTANWGRASRVRPMRMGSSGVNRLRTRPEGVWLGAGCGGSGTLQHRALQGALRLPSSVRLSIHLADNFNFKKCKVQKSFSLYFFVNRRASDW